jgi:hypothetical protein
MTINSWIHKEDSDKKIEKTKKLKKDLDKKSLENQKKKKEEVEILEKAEDNLFELQEMLDDWVLDYKTEDLVEDIVEFDFISQSEIDEIFDKIDEIENSKDIDNVIPKDLRITKEDYKKSLKDDEYRLQTIQKVNSALWIIVRKINPKSWVWINIMGWFLYALDKKLVKIQWNQIDLKNSLKNIELKKFWDKEKNLSFFQKIINFINEVLNSKK